MQFLTRGLTSCLNIVSQLNFHNSFLLTAFALNDFLTVRLPNLEHGCSCELRILIAKTDVDVSPAAFEQRATAYRNSTGDL